MSSGVSILGPSKFAMAVRNQEATIHVGNLDDKVTEALLAELFIQFAPVLNIYMPRDRITGMHSSYAFVELGSPEDADYVSKILPGTRLYSKMIRINRTAGERRGVPVGANLFIGNLAPNVDEKMLQETFCHFGTIIGRPHVVTDEKTGLPRGFAFISYDSFEASDAAIEAMHGRFLCNKPLCVNYAYKKDSPGELHGSAAERIVAAQIRKSILAEQQVRAAQTATMNASSSVQPQNQPYSVPVSHSQHADLMTLSANMNTSITTAPYQQQNHHQHQ